MSQVLLELIMRLQGQAEAAAGMANVGKQGSLLGGTFDDLKKKAVDMAGPFGGVVEKIASVGPAGIAAAAGIGVLAVGVTAALGAWSDYDAGLDTFMAKTGASGAVLDAAGESMKAIKESSAGLGQSLESIGTVMGEVSSRTGATGATLEAFSSKILKMAKLTGGDAVKSVEGVSRAMANWKVPLSQSSDFMDKLYTASTKSGIGVDQLTAALQKSGGPLRNMGLDLNTSIALMAKWEKGGFNAELMLAGMSKAAATFTKAGVPMAQGLQDVVGKIQSMTDKGQAASLAMQTFGAKAGPAMAEAIRSGAFAIDDMKAALEGAKGAIDSTTEKSLDFGDRWEMVMSKTTNALIPVGAALMDLADAVLPAISFALGLIGPVFTAAFAVAGFVITPVIELLKIAVAAIDILTFGLFGLSDKLKPSAENAGEAVAKGFSEGMVKGTDLQPVNDRIADQIGSMDVPDIETSLALQPGTPTDGAIQKAAADVQAKWPAIKTAISLTEIDRDKLLEAAFQTGEYPVKIQAQLDASGLSVEEFNKYIQTLPPVNVPFKLEEAEPKFDFVSKINEQVVQGVAAANSAISGAIASGITIPASSLESIRQAFIDHFKNGAPIPIEIEALLKAESKVELTGLTMEKVLDAVKKALPFTSTTGGGTLLLPTIDVTIPMNPTIQLEDSGGGKAPGLSSPGGGGFGAPILAQIDTLVSTSKTRLGQLVTDATATGKAAMMGLSLSVLTGGATVITNVHTIATGAVGMFKQNFTQTALASIALVGMGGFSGGVQAGGGIAKSQAIIAAAGVRGAIAGGMSAGNFFPSGYNVGLGIASGIASSRPLAVGAAIATANAVKNTINNTLGIHSKSTEGVATGTHYNEGLAFGMAQNKEVLAAVEASIKQIMELASHTVKAGSVDLMKSFGSIMDDLGKVFGALSSMGDPDAKMPVAATFKSFFDAFDALIPQIQFRLLRWHKAFDEEKANLSKFIGEAVNGFLGAVSGFEKLGAPDILWPAQFAFDAFFLTFDAFIPDLQFRLLRWAGAFDTAKADLAKAVGDATNGILGAITGFEKLGDPKLLWPVQFAIDAFFITFDAFVPDLQFRILRWLGAFDPVKAELSKAIGDSVNGILGAVTGFAHLADPKLLFPIQFAVDAFFITFDAFIPDMQLRILRWFGAFDQTKAQLTKDIGDAVNGLIGALSGFLKLGDPKNLYPTQFAITGFFLVLDQFLSEFERYAEAWLSKAPGVLSELSTKIGETAAGIGKAFDPILKMPDIAKIDRGQIEGAFSNLWFALHQLNEVMKSGELQGDWQARATEFATTIGTIGDALRTGLGAITDLGKTEGGGFAALFTELRTLWMGVFGPATQEGTFLYAIFGKPNGMFNWMDTNIPIYMGFSAGVWKQALQGLQAAIGAELAVMKVALYNDALLVGQAIAQGIADGMKGISGAPTNTPPTGPIPPYTPPYVPIPPQKEKESSRGPTFHIEVKAGFGSDGQSIANAVMDAIGDKLYQDRAIRGQG